MVRFLRLAKSSASGLELKLVSGREAGRFLAKRVLYLFLFVYSTLFLAVAIPFFQTPCVPVYFLGAMASAIYFVRLVNYFIKYSRYKNGGISLKEGHIEIISSSGKIEIPTDEISYFEENILGNFIIRQKYSVVSFPLFLLEKGAADVLLGNFEDMAPKRTALFKKIWEFVDAVVVALVLAVHIIQYIIQAYYIPTSSMEDTLLVGDHLFVEKMTFGPMIPEMLFMDKPLRLKLPWSRDVIRNDIVIFRPPHEIDKDYIKRCIALPGDKIEFIDGFVYVNGEKADEPFVKGQTFYLNGPLLREGLVKPENDSRIYNGDTVPAGKIVVMGDNRENSSDGRVFGYLDLDEVKGRAFILYWNTGQLLNFDFSRFGLIR